MKNYYKDKNFLNRIIDKFQRRSRGNIKLIIKNFYFYLVSKAKNITLDKRAHVLYQLKKNCVIAEIGVWKGSFSKKILDIANPSMLVLVDSWTFNENVIGCAPQVDSKEPLNQKFFDDAKTETYKNFINKKNVLILDQSSSDVASMYKNNYFDYIYLDAEHSYHAVTNDLNIWYPKLKNKGILFGDDYYWREPDNSMSLHKAYQDFIAKHQISKWCVFKSQITIVKDEAK